MKKIFIVFFTVLLFSSTLFSQETKRPVRVNNDEDVADLMREAQDGDRGAQFELSMIYMYRQDAQNQLKWLTLSAENGFAKAQYILGNLYYNGTAKIAKDYEKAAFWFSASKESGFNGANIEERIADSKKRIELAKNQAQAKIAAQEAKKRKEELAREAAKTAALEAVKAAKRAATEEIIFASIVSQKSASNTSRTATEKIVSAKFVKEQKQASRPGLFEKLKVKIKALIKEIL
jgi:TPR repeat protein